jgi:molecular chaperone GrpE
MSQNASHDPAVPTPDQPTAAAANPATPAPASTATGPSETELQQLRDQAAKADENWDKYLRAVAELDNYRKRAARDRDEQVRATQERVVAALLPVLDNFERALEAFEQHKSETQALVEGIKQIQTQFRRTLEEFGLQEVAAHAGHPFDPNLHEAVGQIESPEHPEGAVARQLQRGYKLANRLLRPARVVVSKGKPATN